MMKSYNNMPRHGHGDPEWIPVNTPARPIEMLTGVKCGAFKWRQLEDHDNCGDLEIWCRDGFTKKEYLIAIPYLCEEGFKAWMDGAMIQNALPHLSPTIRDYLLGIFDEA